jgi:hypothetical protein
MICFFFDANKIRAVAQIAFYASTSSARTEKSNDFKTPPLALSLSKGKRWVWATARIDLTLAYRFAWSCTIMICSSDTTNMTFWAG